METLQLLATALGFATLAGINLYLTVFVSGLAIHNGWVHLSAQYHQLQVLGEPAIIVVAGVLYAVEFFADKIPGLDSAWDFVHTAIRPIGGAFLALRTLGSTDVMVEILVALLGGGVALTAHGAKAGTRLLVNASPEPFSNIALSTAEDVGVLGGLWLIHAHPAIAFVVFTCLVATLLYVTPKLFRVARVKLSLLWRKFSAAAGTKEADLRAALPADAAIALAELNKSGAKPAWAAPCLTGGGRAQRLYARGHLVALEGEPSAVYFVGRHGWGKVAQRHEIAGAEVTRESKFLSENVVVYATDGRPKLTWIFDRPSTPTAAAVAEKLTAQLTAKPVSLVLATSSAKDL